jgi:DNA-binding NarL/FixJ family response regulator
VTIRVLIADRHEIVRFGLRTLIEAQPGWEVCGEATSGEEVLELAQSAEPHVAVFDVDLPGLSGITVAGKLRATRQGPDVLLYSTHDDPNSVTSALAAGARGYVMKHEGLGQVIEAVRALAGRKAYLSPAASQLVLEHTWQRPRGPSVENLTAREMEVVQLIADGQSSKWIARRLDISFKTVESHRAAAMRKSGTRTVAQLVRFAIKHHLVAS